MEQYRELLEPISHNMLFELIHQGCLDLLPKNLGHLVDRSISKPVAIRALQITAGCQFEKEVIEDRDVKFETIDFSISICRHSEVTPARP